MYQCDGLWNCHAYRHTVQAERQAAAGVLGFVVGNGGVAKTLPVHSLEPEVPHAPARHQHPRHRSRTVPLELAMPPPKCAEVFPATVLLTTFRFPPEPMVEKL